MLEAMELVYKAVKILIGIIKLARKIRDELKDKE